VVYARRLAFFRPQFVPSYDRRRATTVCILKTEGFDDVSLFPALSNEPWCCSCALSWQREVAPGTIKEHRRFFRSGPSDACDHTLHALIPNYSPPFIRGWQRRGPTAAMLEVREGLKLGYCHLIDGATLVSKIDSNKLWFHVENEMILYSPNLVKIFVYCCLLA